MKCPTIRTHPFCGKAARLAGTNVPRNGVEHAGPWPPRLRSVIDGKAAAKPSVATGQSLAPQIPLESRVVGNARTIALTRLSEDGAALIDSARPNRLSGGIELLKEL